MKPPTKPQSCWRKLRSPFGVSGVLVGGGCTSLFLFHLWKIRFGGMAPDWSLLLACGAGMLSGGLALYTLWTGRSPYGYKEEEQ